MNNLWKNIKKFPLFIIAVFIGFFLTTIQPIFKLLKNKKQKILIPVIIGTIFIITYNTLRLMLEIE
uniref:hypothetical protein n=1 Tax=Hypnea brasiliensis TaxID=1866962 RepID=UPI0023F26D1E|nr:hypothetical protein P8481_pgp067 [Hypnea brasiliensis]WCH55404.1 hypothetical protein [Hypnea brasiliensis]WDY84805.1 hypothetical protein [Hypnea brasiliensis]